MWRAALALVLVSATGCGKHAEDGPAVVAGAPAGAVVAIDGVVTAGARTLAIGDAITADDEIATADGAHVTIELAHNHARWSLGPKRHEKPRDAAAWRLAKAEGSADSVHATATSAGRDGERSAADTDISTPATTQAQPAGGESRTGAPVAPGAAATAQQPEVDRAPKDVPHVGSRPAPTTPPPAPSPRRLEPTADDEKVANLQVTERRAPVSSATRARQILAGDAALRACLKAAASAELTVACDAGTCKVTKFSVAADQPCVAERVGKLGLPQGTYEISIPLTAPGR